jgi:glycerol uptake facilitator-like aquaporin
MQKMSPYLAEFIGTLFFLFVILFTGEALPIGLALIIVILILGKFSGGHFNPAVTIMMVFAKNGFKIGDALPYILAQILGGLTALIIYNGTK